MSAGDGETDDANALQGLRETRYRRAPDARLPASLIITSSSKQPTISDTTPTHSES